ncbi:MAG: beta-ketoacyl-ACP reductase [Deltaproteobacteria bacterium]|nr:MAG: beta-ketoacyl-ACP reductase [Deltaproteobacteria bacterium]
MSFFKDKKVIVTGATRGIGKAVSCGFMEQGAAVIGLYGGNEGAARQFEQEAAEKSWQLDLFKCDISQEEEVNDFFKVVEKQHDTIDVLVNNAGIRRDAIVALMKTEQWERVLDINLKGTFFMSRSVIPLMMKQKFGRIINITSPMSYLGFAGQANYAASKAGQIGFAKSLAKETAKKKITVNCVSPGFVATELLDDLPAEQIAEYKKMVPMRRFGTAGEIADAVLFLASDKAAYISGAVLEVNGGL